MLHPHLDEWIKESKRVGMTTSIVSNGTKMSREWLESMRPYLTGWVSVDASNDQMHAIMGRLCMNSRMVCLDIWSAPWILLRWQMSLVMVSS